MLLQGTLRARQQLVWLMVYLAAEDPAWRAGVVAGHTEGETTSATVVCVLYTVAEVGAVRPLAHHSIPKTFA